MTKEHADILDAIGKYLDKNPSARFMQALSNLNITEFADPINPEKKGHLLRDAYNDSDIKVLTRIRKA